MSYVNSVTVYPSSATITKGKWYYGAYASISSDCPECAEVEWYSNSPAIASVNKTTGYIYGVSTGTTRIYAIAKDDDSKKDYIEVTVTPPVSVTGISVCPTSLTMNVGDTDYLYETVYPSNATNQTVTWCSSNENVATVGLYTGKITAKMAGTTTITATTADGGFSTSCEVTVYIDTVTIMKDEVYNKVVFQNSGKVWRCINNDMIFDKNPNMPWLNTRSNYNFFTHYNEKDLFDIDQTPKEYTDDEIKLLFAIDPYGVADYVHRYADDIFKRVYRTESMEESSRSEIEYKDRIFEVLFKRKPQYFKRTIQGTWYPVSRYDEINDVVSESETLFGGHRIWDSYTTIEIVEAIVNILNIALSIISVSKKFKDLLEANKNINTVFEVLSFIVNCADGGFKSAVIDEFVEAAFKATSLEWAYNIVSAYNSLEELVSDFDTGDNYYPLIFEHCIVDMDYKIYVELKNGVKHQLEEISELIYEFK